MRCDVCGEDRDPSCFQYVYACQHRRVVCKPPRGCSARFQQLVGQAIDKHIPDLNQGEEKK